MSFLIEINHPGQVHLLHQFIKRLQLNDKRFVVIAKYDKSILELLEVFKIPYTIIGNKGKGTIGKLFKQIIFTYRALKIVKKYNLTIGVGSSFTNDLLTIFSKNFESIHLSDDDEEMVPFITNYSYPFASVILAPDCINFKKYYKKVISYAGYHELAYLHPDIFTPDVSVLKELNLTANEPFFILRFVALKGHHDKGHLGLNIQNKKKLIDYLLTYGKVFITSEKKIEKEFEKYRIKISPEKIHSVLYYAKAFIGDSQTMTSEAAILGTPALKCNTFAGKLSVPNEIQNKYKLCFSYQPEDFSLLMDKLKDILLNYDDELWEKRRKKLLAEKINVSAFLFEYTSTFKEK
jgi:predicted glycosyltransferase